MGRAILLFSLFCLAGRGLSAVTPLDVRVTGYWDALRAGRLQQAASFVDPLSRSRFLQRRSLRVVDWKLGSQRLEGQRAGVSVQVRFGGLPSGGVLPGRVEQIWKLLDGEWFLEVPTATPVELNRLLYGPVGSREIPRGVISAEPRLLVLRFLNPVQRGIVRLSNGRDVVATSVSCSSDSGDLDVRADLDRIEPGQSVRLTVDVRGTETKKNRSGNLTCRFEVDGRPEQIEIPVFFNVISAEERAFFGLSEEQTEALRRNEPLRPAVKRPQ